MFVAVGLMAPAPPGPTIIFVDDDNCPGPGDGSIREPYCSIQTAIDNAALSGDEIVVAPGTYFETINFLGKAIWLHSADGAEVTVIDATGLEDSVVKCVSGEGSDTILDDFTITGGDAPFGGGMQNDGSSPTVTNCVFSGNEATDGGGMSNDNCASPTVTNCTFSGNSAWIFAGGMKNDWFSSPTVTNCTFSGNTSTHDGGGMWNTFFSSPTVTDCTFSENSAGCHSGGGMSNDWGACPVVTNCTFSGNSARCGSGGGMSNDTSPVVTNCTFSGNEARYGGGMYNSGASPTVTNCTFSGNTASNEGGGMRNIFSSPTVTNCTFSGNTASNEGGGMWNYSIGSPTVTNCVVWGNSPEQIADGDNAATVRYSDVQGGFPGTGNIDADPLFVDPANGDYRLQAGSPCNDAGHNWAIAGLTDVDLDGNPRFADDPATADTGCGVPVIVDMGPYEFQGLPADVVTLGDIDGDGVVGTADLLVLLDAWGPVGEPCDLADLDLDGVVSTSDLLTMLGNWGADCGHKPIVECRVSGEAVGTHRRS